MRGRAQRKVVTSGRLTGAVRGGLVNLNPGTAPCPEPAYSLYSTDSEDQVISLHKGLDRCAALLSGILQADKAVSPRLHRTVSSAAVKSRLSTSVGKKSLKKVPPKPGQSVSGQRGSDSRAPRGHPSARPAPHSGVKLHPTRKRCPTQLQSRLLSAQDQTPQLLAHTVSPTQREASVLLPAHQPPSLSSHPAACRPDSQTLRATCDEAQEFVPVRDTDAQSPSTRTLTHAHRDSCSTKMAHLQLEPGQAEEAPEESNAEAQTKAHKLQHLFAQLKALIAGQGSVAESLLSHLEQTVSTPQMNTSASNTQNVSDLHSRVRILNQQPEKHQNRAILCNLHRLQEELSAAQSRLRELQDDLTDLRKTLQDTQSQLSDREAETALVKMELEASKSRLLDSEREKSKLALLAEQRLKEMEHLKSLLSSDYPAVVDSSVSETSQHQHIRDPPAPPTDHVAQYLKSLSQMAPVQCVDADPASHLDITAQRREDPAGTRHESNRERSAGAGEALRPEDARRQLFNSTLSQCETESVWSDLTFDTRDEAAFRDGLAALDASIASLQKTIKLDLRR